RERLAQVGHVHVVAHRQAPLPGDLLVHTVAADAHQEAAVGIELQRHRTARDSRDRPLPLRPLDLALVVRFTPGTGERYGPDHDDQDPDDGTHDRPQLEWHRTSPWPVAGGAVVSRV